MIEIFRCCYKNNKVHPVLTTNDSLTTRAITILLVGIEKSGKSTLLLRWQDKQMAITRPTKGVRPSAFCLDDSCKIKVLDVGGSKEFRTVWKSHFHTCHCVSFLLDISSTDARYRESLEVLRETSNHFYLQGKPFLVLCTSLNGENGISQRSVEQVRQECLATKKSPMQWFELSSGREKEPLHWLVNTTLSQFEAIEIKRKSDGDIVQAERERKNDEREKKAISSSLCKAFGVNNVTKTDVFTVSDGEEFFAQELGLQESSSLDREMRDLCSMLGYQKYGLMIVAKRLQEGGSVEIERRNIKDLRQRLNLLTPL